MKIEIKITEERHKKCIKWLMKLEDGEIKTLPEEQFYICKIVVDWMMMESDLICPFYFRNDIMTIKCVYKLERKYFTEYFDKINFK